MLAYRLSRRGTFVSGPQQLDFAGEDISNRFQDRRGHNQFRDRKICRAILYRDRAALLEAYDDLDQGREIIEAAQINYNE